MLRGSLAGGLSISVPPLNLFTGRVSESSVCPALLDVYFGASPISSSVKEGMAAGYSAATLYDTGKSEL